MINPMEMTGRCVIVTGSAQGIGLNTARLPSELGAARSIAFLLSGASRHITGQHLALNGGSHMAA